MQLQKKKKKKKLQYSRTDYKEIIKYTAISVQQQDHTKIGCDTISSLKLRMTSRISQTLCIYLRRLHCSRSYASKDVLGKLERIVPSN